MKKSVLFCAAELKRSWLNDPGRAMAAVSAARLVTQYPSAIRHTAIERPSWIPFAVTKLPSRHESRTKPMDVFPNVPSLGECCRPEACNRIPPMGEGVSSQRVREGRERTLTPSGSTVPIDLRL